MDLLTALFSDFGLFFSSDPSVFGFQLLMLSLAGVVVFLVLWTARDIMLRSDSFVIQLLSIVLVAALPGLGFFIYLLVRPSSTIRQKKLEQDLELVLSKMAKHGKEQKPEGSKKS